MQDQYPTARNAKTRNRLTALASENPTGHLLRVESLDRRIRISKRVTSLSERGRISGVEGRGTNSSLATGLKFLETHTRDT